MENIGKFVVSLAIVIFGVVYGGWVLCLLWAWFIVPVFGMPALTVAHAVGLKLVAGYLTASFSEKETQTMPFWKQLAKSLGMKIAWGLLALLTGLIVKQFV